MPDGYEIISISKDAQTYIDPTLTSPDFETVSYTLSSEYTKDQLVNRTIAFLDASPLGGSGAAEINVLNDEFSDDLGNAFYEIPLGTLTTNSLYELFEELTAYTNGGVYAKYSRVWPIIGNGESFSDTVNIQITPGPEFSVNGRPLLGQIGTNDTTLALTAATIERVGDFDPNSGNNPCSPDCSGCQIAPPPFTLAPSLQGNDDNGGNIAGDTDGAPSSNGPRGMPVWRVSEPDINLHVFDTPVTYKTSLGQPMSFSLRYDQRDPRMTNSFVPASGWNNSWSSYVHVFATVNTNGTVNFRQWTGYLYSRGGGMAVYDYTNTTNPETHSCLSPLNNRSPVGTTTNYGDNGFRLSANDGSVDIYGLVTPVYSTFNAEGLNAVDTLVNQGSLPTGLSAQLFMNRMQSLPGGWSANEGFQLEGASSGGGGSGGGGGGGFGGGGSANSRGFYGGGLTPTSWAPDILHTPGLIITNSEVDALLTEHIDRFGNTTRFFYTNAVTSSGATNFLLQYVVDPDGKTNTLAYNADGTISGVTTPYGQSASFSYTAGQLTGITDAQSMSSSMTYNPSNGWMSELTTPYGNTFFTIWDNGSVYENGFEYGSAQGTNLISRAILVTRPDSSQDLYAYRYDCSEIGVAAAFSPSPAGSTPIGTIDDGSTYGSDPDAAFNLRNSFHWGPKQCSEISTTTNLTALTAQDYLMATMSHWLVGRNVGTAVGGDISAVVQGSTDGTHPGQVTWFDYAGKPTPYQIGPAPLSRVLQAQIIPMSDGSTSIRYTDTSLTNGLPASETSTYSKTDGTVGTRTYTAAYTNITISLAYTNGGSQISSASWSFPELLSVTGPLGETQYSSDSNYVTQAYYETNFSSTSGLQIPERRVVVSVDAVTNSHTAYYNARGQLAGSYFAGLTTTNLFDANGYPAQSIAIEIQRTNSFSFVNGRLASATSPLGLVTQYSWDNLNRLTGVNFPDGTSVSNIYTRLDVTDQKDRLGNWLHATYDSVRHMTGFTDRNGNSTVIAYCPCGALESVTDPLYGETTYGRDCQNRLTNILDVASGRTFGLTLDLPGQVVNVSDSADAFYGSSGFSLAYNIQGLLTNVIYGGSLAMYGAGYDIYDRRVQAVDANGVGVSSTFDLLGRLLTRSYPNGGKETNVYSALGLVKHSDLNGQPTTYGYDPAGRLISVTNADLATYQLAYDAANDLLTLKDGRGNTTGWRYDLYRRAIAKTNGLHAVVWTNGYNANGWPVSTWTPAKGLATLGYDANGNLTSLAMSGLSLARTYDALNRPTRIDEGNLRLNFGYTNFGAFKGALSFENAQPINGALDPGDALRAVAYGYTAELLSRQTRPDQTVSYTNDILGRLLGLAGHAGGFSYTYNGGGNRVQTLNYPATYSSWAYDAMAELTNLNIYVSDGQTTVGYDYDRNGNRLHVWRAKDLASGYDSQVAYGYDAIGQLTSAVGTETGGTSRLNEQFGYGYDLAGNLTGRTNGALTQAFTADGANELTNLVRGGSLTFAGEANPALTSLTVNSQSTAQYSDQTFATTTGLSLANGTNTFTVIAADAGGDRITNIYTANLPATNRCKYDANGNLVSDGMRGFDYDGLNELVRVTLTNAWKTEYDYDGLGRHHDRREYVWWPGTASWYLINECYYVYAGHQVVQEVNTTEGTASYVYGLSLLERDSTVTNQPTVFYHTDANGNMTTLFDGTGQVQGRYLYDPYGNLLARSGPMADVNRYRFSGQEWDPHTGLYYYGYRFYDPNFQRWLNQDPIAENGGINLYRFVGNDPVNYVDPLGLEGNPVSSTLSGASGAWNSNPFGGGGSFYNPGFLNPQFDWGAWEAQQQAQQAQEAAQNQQWLDQNYPTLGGMGEYANDFLNSDLGQAMMDYGPYSMGMGEAPPSGCKLFRYRNGPESAARLARKAQEAENKIGVHGVSTSMNNLGPGAQSVDASLAQQYFNVGQTGSDPFHFTIELPKPVTPQVANQFNSLPWK